MLITVSLRQRKNLDAGAVHNSENGPESVFVVAQQCMIFFRFRRGVHADRLGHGKYWKYATFLYVQTCGFFLQFFIFLTNALF